MVKSRYQSLRKMHKNNLTVRTCFHDFMENLSYLQMKNAVLLLFLSCGVTYVCISWRLYLEVAALGHNDNSNEDIIHFWNFQLLAVNLHSFTTINLTSHCNSTLMNVNYINSKALVFTGSLGY